MATKDIDLNLFKVFTAVMRHGTAKGAAQELSVGPPAVSHALRRLRSAMGDELFVPRRGKMEPTKLALDLASEITEGISRLEGVITSAPFVPGTTARTFHIAGGDYAATMILPSLMARVSTAAPQVHLRFFPSNRLDVVANLDDGRVDLAFGWFDAVPQRMRRSTVAIEQEVILVREGHPLSDGEMTVERLLSFRRVVVELTGSEEQLKSGFFNERGASRRIWIDRLVVGASAGNEGLIGEVALSVPYFSAVPPILELTDMVAVLPKQLAVRLSRQNRLILLDPPYEPAEVCLEVVWHERVDRDAGAQWLIKQLLDGGVPIMKDEGATN